MSDYSEMLLKVLLCAASCLGVGLMWGGSTQISSRVRFGISTEHLSVSNQVVKRHSRSQSAPETSKSLA